MLQSSAFALDTNDFDDDGVPHITKFAHKKARMIVDLALSIKLTEEMFASGSGGEEDAMDIDNEEEGDSESEDEDSVDTLVR